MMFKLSAVFCLALTVLPEPVHAQCETEISGPIAVAGASSVGRLVGAWMDAYKSECGFEGGNETISIETGRGSSDGASRVCGDTIRSDPVHIGGTVRTLNPGEATSENDWQYECTRSTRTLLQVEVASEGISMATSLTGNAATCISNLGGLTFDQLRWIFSSYDENQLAESGWSPNSVPNSDNNPSTHLWSELDGFCPEEEIDIAYPDNGATDLLFRELIFQGVDETFAADRGGTVANATSNAELVQFLLENGNGLSFFELAYVIADIDQESINLVSINDGEEYIKPGALSFHDSTYPMARRLYMYLHDDEESLASTSSLIEFGLSSAGDVAVKSVGLWPLDDWEKLVMRTRIQTPSGIPWSSITESCGPDGSISIAGSSTVFPLARLWAELYNMGCPQMEFTVEGGGSSTGAGRVCGNPSRGTPVDIGDMSREWKDSEATQVQGYIYECLEPGDTARSATQIDVAIDGLTVAVKEGGAAWECVQILGGLTPDQLRWIYSDYTDSELEKTGWDPLSLKNSDRNSQTHLWSELDDTCERIEIRIAGADDRSGTYEYFLEAILVDHGNGETFDTSRPGFGYENSELDEVLVEYISEFAEAISYFGYSYYYANRASLSAVAIANSDGNYILPNAETIGDGTYNPLARRIYMNLYNDDASLERTSHFVEFALSNPATVAATGHVAIPEEDATEMLNRMKGVPEETSAGTSIQTFLAVYFSVGISLFFSKC